MGVGVASSGSGGQGFAFRLEGDGDSKIGNSDGDLHQVTGTLQLNENVFFLANGRVGIGDSAPSYKLTVGGSMEVGEYIYHRSDTDTFIRFQADSINFQAGGADFITLTEADQDEVVINENSSDIDFRVESNGQTHMLFVDGANDRVGILTDSPGATLSVAGVVSSSHGATLGNLILQDDATSLQVSGTISSSVGATLGNLILQDDARSLTLSGTISSSAGATFLGPMIADEVNVSGNLKLHTDAPELTVRRDDNDDDSTLQFQGSGGVVGAYVKFLGDESSGGGTNNDLALGTGASVAERIRIRGDGKVGIGTTSPTALLSVAGVVSSSHGSTLGNLILQDDTTSLQVSGTISSSAGATLGNLILQDDATSLQLSGAVLMSDKGASGNTAIYDATGSSVTRVTGTLDIKGHHVQAITRTDLGNGATSTITGTTGIHFLDASEVTTGAGGTHVITVSTGTLDGQYLVLAITGTINNTTIIAGNTSVAASGEITFTGTASDNQTLTIKDTSGNAKTVTTSTSVSCGTAVRGDASSQVAGINGCPNAAFTAAAIYTAIAAGISSDSWPFTLDPGFSAGTDTSFTISQNVVGAGGNQTITSNLSNVSVTGFSGGGVSLGTVNSDNGISMGYGQINGPVVHLVFDTRSNQWQPISANHITS